MGTTLSVILEPLGTFINGPIPGILIGAAVTFLVQRYSDRSAQKKERVTQIRLMYATWIAALVRQKHDSNVAIQSMRNPRISATESSKVVTTERERRTEVEVALAQLLLVDDVEVCTDEAVRITEIMPAATAIVNNPANDAAMEEEFVELCNQQTIAWSRLIQKVRDRFKDGP